VRLTTLLQVGAKYLGCVVCRFHVAAGTGSASCQKPVSINLQKWFLSPNGRLNFGFITEGNLTAVLITPYSWGSQLDVNHAPSLVCMEFVRARTPPELFCSLSKFTLFFAFFSASVICVSSFFVGLAAVCFRISSDMLLPRSGCSRQS
jgi:hypothetical protein